MSRAFIESNVAQASREIVQHLLAFPVAAGMAVYAHKTTKNSNANGPFFLIPLAVMLQIFGREMVWLIRYVRWRIRDGREQKNRRRTPREAKTLDYVLFTTLHTLLFLFAAVPLAINLIAESVGQYDFNSIHAWIDPFAFGGIVAFITGDLLGAGLIAGLERWGP